MARRGTLKGSRTVTMLRPAVMASHGMVASGHPLASGAGLDILKAGGNAFDAAIATNAVLNVTQPHTCGIGGDVFYLLYNSRERKVRFLNGSGCSGYLASRKFYREKGYDRIPLSGPLSMITVPGCVDAWETMLRRYGTMGFKELLGAAIGYAENGHPVSHKTSYTIGDNENLPDHASSSKIFLAKGRAPRPGENLVQRDLGKTFRAIAEGGRDAFYKGEIAKKITMFSRQIGGILEEKDFADHRSTWAEPIRTNYRGYTIYQTPPNTQGIASLIGFNILEGFDLTAMGHNSADFLHHMCETKKIAFKDRDRYVTDPAFSDIPLRELLDKDYAARCRALINPNRAMPNRPLFGEHRGDTTYFAIADGHGNLVSCIQSLYFPFGSCVVAEGTGIMMQNRGAYFSLDPEHVNTLQPHKRTMHTLMASMVFDGTQDPYLLFGSMGGDGQPQTHLAVISNILDFRLNMQQAIEAPRWIHGNTVIGEPKAQFNIEGRVPRGTIHELERKGHDVNVMEAWSQNVGHAQGILMDKETGVLQGGADPRGDGYVMGW